MRTSKIISIMGSVFLLGSLLWSSPLIVQAATLSLSSQSANVGVGDIFPVRVLLDSPGEAANAISGQVAFPTDLLQVSSLTKGSLINFWVEQPNFSNGQGVVRFEGVTFNPGFSGVNGQVLTINFRAEKTGQASLGFQSASVLANDGEGTDITEGKRGTAITISPRKTIPASTTLGLVAITSPTHPDPTRWYSNHTAEFSLVAVSGTEAISAIVDNLANTIPSTTVQDLISSYRTPELANGEWYLHARAKRFGRWGESSHFLFRIDSQPPQPFVVKLPSGSETSDNRPEIVFGTTDLLSGVNHYEVFIGDRSFTTIPEQPGELYHILKLPYQFWGQERIRVVAVDNAGNKEESTLAFTIVPGLWVDLLLVILLFLLINLLRLPLKRRRFLESEVAKVGVSHGIPPEKSTSLFERSDAVGRDISNLELDLKSLMALKDDQKAFAYLKSARARQLGDLDIQKELIEVGWTEEEVQALLREEAVIKSIHQKVETELKVIEEQNKTVAP